MRRVILIMVALVSLGIPAGAAAASTKHRHTKPTQCPPVSNDVVLAADARSVVYRAPFSVEMGLRYVFGCSVGARRVYRLGRINEGSAAGSVGTGPIALAGPIVAYAVSEFTETLSRSEIVVRDLANGEVIYRTPNGSPAKAGDVGLGETTAIVVKRDGSVAWITRASRELGSIEVRSEDAAGDHLLAASPEIEPDSLALAGGTVYWTQGGKPMSAVLE